MERQVKEQRGDFSCREVEVNRTVYRITVEHHGEERLEKLIERLAVRHALSGCGEYAAAGIKAAKVKACE